MKRLFYLFFFSFFSISFADKNCNFVSDGNNKVFKLKDIKIDSSSIIIFSNDTILKNWTYNTFKNEVIFDTPIDSGKVVKIDYKCKSIGFPSDFSLYSKHYITKDDSIFTDKNSTKLSLLNNSEDLSITGYKSFSISADNYGSVNIEQGLDIRINGNIRPKTELSAHLNDEGSSLEEETKEISDFDLIYMQIVDPNFKVTVGDQYEQWIDGGIFNKQKKIKGLSASLIKKNFNIEAFGSIAGGTFVVQNMYGKNGIQGPYYLKGKGEDGFITPVSGTLTLKLNGNELKENQDYLVDYDMGYITFKNTILIKDNDIIRVEYEYKIFDYQQILSGIKTSFTNNDSSILFKGILWTDFDNKNHLIDLSLTDGDKKVLRNSGDSLPYITTESEIDPKDVPAKSVIYPLYKKVKDQDSSDYYVFTKYNPTNPQDCKDYYNVWFREVGDKKGDYIRDSLYLTDYIYTYSKGKGNYSPTRILPAPKRVTTGEIYGEINKDLIKIKTHIAGENNDMNTFSSKDDKDNNSSLIKSSLLLGKKDQKGVWFSGDYSFSSGNSSNDILTKYEELMQWNDSTSSEAKVDRYFYSGSLGYKPFKWFQIETGYGQKRLNDKLITDKITNITDFYFKYLHLNYSGILFQNYDDLYKNSRRESINASSSLKNSYLQMQVLEEWKNYTNNGNGKIEGQFSYNYLPLNLLEFLSYAQFRSGQSQIQAKDTGYSYVWNQSIDCKPLKNWNLKFNSTFNKTFIDSNSTITLLANLNNELEINGFIINQQYSTDFQKASSVVQIPVYAGKGLGTYMYDSTLNKYVPHTPGDWFIQQKEIYDQTSDTRIRKTILNIDWSYQMKKPIKGILKDLSWYGLLSLEEHVNAEYMKFKSWIPGIVTLSEENNDGKKSDYADLSYRQEINWKPDWNKNITGLFYIMPSYERQSENDETGLNSGIKINSNFSKLNFVNETKYLSIKTINNTSENQSFKDLSSELTEKIKMVNDFYFYVKENVGMAAQDIGDQKKSLFEVDSTFYYQIGPGLQWQPVKFGSAEISYTYSDNPFKNYIDYRMASGYKPGKSHVISGSVVMQTNKHFLINCMYRGEFSKNTSSEEKMSNQTFSMEAKVLF